MRWVAVDVFCGAPRHTASPTHYLCLFVSLKLMPPSVGSTKPHPLNSPPPHHPTPSTPRPSVQLEVVKQLLVFAKDSLGAEGRDRIYNARDHYGLTALSHAARKHHLNVVEALCVAGVTLALATTMP